MLQHFSRHVEKHLEQWKKSANRKPLILRGARQVGKTTIVKSFSKSYKYFINLNLEHAEALSFFKRYDSVSKIVDALFIEHNISSSEKQNCLLFIDEIQESPKAISLLRYFYEDEPKLHVIAAGSLLENALKKVKSFPVGRVSYLYVHPMNFEEFLDAKRHQLALKHLNKLPVNLSAHYTLLDLFHEYAIIGGMPEVIQAYLTTGNISDLPPVYESIWQTYKDDVEKYASNATEARVIRHIAESMHLYIDQRVKMQGFGNSNYRSREVGEALRSLEAAKVSYLIYPTTDTTPPLKPDLKKSPRLLLLDTGLINHELNIQGELLAVKDFSNAYKGALLPHIIMQEMLSLNTTSFHKPLFWVRQKTQSSAEADMVVQHKGTIIPIEVKSGKAGKLKSLHQFIEKADHHYAVRMYGGCFIIEEAVTPGGKKYFLMNLPYYLGTKIKEYIDYFTKKY